MKSALIIFLFFNINILVKAVLLSNPEINKFGLDEYPYDDDTYKNDEMNFMENGFQESVSLNSREYIDSSKTGIGLFDSNLEKRSILKKKPKETFEMVYRKYCIKNKKLCYFFG